MANTYRPLSVAAKSQYGEDVVELDLSVPDEKDALDGGHLQIAPREYRVLSDNYTAGKQGDVVDLALLKENEEALIAGGHIERVDKPISSKAVPADGGSDDKPAAKAAEKKEK